VIRTYREQAIIENVFRAMKSPHAISIRPVYHHVDHSILLHAFICVLSYLLLSLTRLRLVRRGLPLGLGVLLSTLRDIRVTRLSLPGVDKAHYKLNVLSGLSGRVYNALNLKRYLR
ncbi:MAG: hypothetical protein ACTSRA_08445, partial [Promethearchaeota archaeon]